MAIETQPKSSGKGAMALALVAALLGWMFDGLEMGLIPLVGRSAIKELIGPAAGDSYGWWFAGIMAMFLVGAACGGLIFGWLGDRIGRVKAMVISIATYAIFSGLCGFSTEAWHLASLRFLASLGMGGEWALGVALVMEIWPAKYRPLLAGIIGAASNVGFLFIGLVGMGLAQVLQDFAILLGDVGFSPETVERLVSNSGWRLMFFIGATPAILAFLVQIFVPESEKWKHAAATTPKNKVSDIFKGGLAKVAIFGSILGAIALLGTWGSVQWIPAWANQMSKSLPPESAQLAKFATSLTQIASAGGAIVGCVFGALFAQWTSRRLGYFVLCLASLVTCQILFRVPMELGVTFFAWVFVVGGLTAAFYGWLPLYLPELFPTRVRATGQGFSFNAGRILAAGGTIASGGLLTAFKEDYAAAGAITCLIYVVGMAFIWFCPETKGKPLPE
jgi:SHS family sialic acid transporter-like MFS transporter